MIQHVASCCTLCRTIVVVGEDHKATWWAHQDPPITHCTFFLITIMLSFIFPLLTIIVQQHVPILCWARTVVQDHAGVTYNGAWPRLLAAKPNVDARPRMHLHKRIWSCKQDLERYKRAVFGGLISVWSYFFYQHVAFFLSYLAGISLLPLKNHGGYLPRVTPFGLCFSHTHYHNGYHVLLVDGIESNHTYIHSIHTAIKESLIQPTIHVENSSKQQWARNENDDRCAKVAAGRWCVYLQLKQGDTKRGFPMNFCGEDGLVVRITAETCLLFSSIQIQRCGVIQQGALRIRMWICNVACVCVWIKAHQWLMIPFSGLKPREWSGFDVRTWRHKKHLFHLQMLDNVINHSSWSMWQKHNKHE